MTQKPLESLRVKLEKELGKPVSTTEMVKMAGINPRTYYRRLDDPPKSWFVAVEGLIYQAKYKQIYDTLSQIFENASESV